MDPFDGAGPTLVPPGLPGGWLRARRVALAGAGIALGLAALVASTRAEAAGTPPSGQTDPAAALGCGGCHAGVPDGGIRERAPALGAGGAQRTAEAIFTSVVGTGAPRAPTAPARMPDFGLDESERVALTLFLAGEPSGAGAYAAARARHDDVGADDGERVFRALNCAACHQHPSVAPRRDAPDLTDEGARVRATWLREYLARPGAIRPTGAPAGTWSRMPDFHLSDAEVDALVQRLLPTRPTATDAPAPLPAHRVTSLEIRLQNRLSCLGCHRLDGRGGGLGPPLDGVASRLAPAYLREVVHDPLTAVPDGSMPPAPLRPGEAEELTRYLAARDGPWARAERRSLTDPAVARAMAATTGARGDAGGRAGATTPDGAALYGRLCASCHGVAGRGDGWNAAALPVAPTPHAEAGLMSLRPDDTLFDGIHGGGWVLDGSPAMPAFGGMLSPVEIRALVEHIRRLCSCRGPDWARDGGSAPPGLR
ncbi:MAG: c-type cytochrome [Gemmatimonadetes bacterium]|nr:c-type cytochrome [Gemmatimonadota bacterium]